MDRLKNLIHAHLEYVDDEFSEQDVLLLMKTAYNLALKDALDNVELEIGEFHKASINRESILELVIK